MKHLLKSRWVTDRGLLLQTGEATLAAYNRLLAADCAEVEALVPGDGNLLVVLRPGFEPPQNLAEWLEQPGGAAQANVDRAHELPVVFDGEDLDEVAKLAGWVRGRVVETLLGLDLRVQFLGFQPGFAYLRGLPKALCLPRRSHPRKRVPAGSLALGGGYCGVYPAQGPGGWHLIGHTECRLFDPNARPPTLFAPGDTVRLVAA